mmetsp:Transcript_84/g.197  ORF Transcript_84/g.197 Transcript_84/m.197 type:complete len:230 (+) Transcript_84:66-755(+)
MPPNRKSPTIFENNYEFGSLHIPLQTKYLPLTDPREAGQQLEQEHQSFQQELITDPKKEKPATTASYWDWPSDTAAEEKLAAVDDLFSTSRFESNLIADSTRREKDTSLQVHVFTKEDQEESTEERQCYWDWSNELSDSVKPDGDCQHINPTPDNDDRHCENCCDDYWAWHQDEVIEDTCSDSSPSHRLQNMVLESQKKIVRRYNHLSEPDPGPNTTAASDYYFYWSEF